MSPRRQEDPEDFDPKPLRGPGGIPWKSLLGWSLPSFLVLYLLGAVPGLPAPRLSWPGASAANHDGGGLRGLLIKHEETSQAQLRLLRMICRGAWRHVPEVASECDERPR